jgi:hypothetical protein
VSIPVFTKPSFGHSRVTSVRSTLYFEKKKTCFNIFFRLTFPIFFFHKFSGSIFHFFLISHNRDTHSACIFCLYCSWVISRRLFNFTNLERQKSWEGASRWVHTKRQSWFIWGSVVVLVWTVKKKARTWISPPIDTGTTAITIGHSILQSVFQLFG